VVQFPTKVVLLSTDEKAYKEVVAKVVVAAVGKPRLVLRSPVV
jgi:hypothetical protein